MKPIHTMRAAAVFAILLAMATVVWLYRGSYPQTKMRPVSVGLYENAPKVYTDKNGRPAGLFIELLEQIAKRENWQIRYVPCQWAECLEKLAQGQLDLMPDVAFSAERAQRFDFHTVSVASSWSQVYSHPQLKSMSLADLANKRIAILEGGIQQRFFAQLMASGNFPYQEKPVADLDAGYQAVLEGKADAVVSNSFFAAHNGAKYRLQETPLVFLPSNLYFATGRGRNADLLEHIDAHLTAWRRDSTSPYFEAIRRAMAAPPELLVPHWVGWSLAGLIGSLLLLLAVSILLRTKVEERTRELKEAAGQLELERANLEDQVAARTVELKAAKDEAERLSRVKSDFLANMSHEIRTPMNAVLGMLYLALKNELPPALANQLNKAQGAARSLLGIINDILDFSKIEAGKLELEEVEFGLDTVLEQLTDAVGSQAGQKGVEFLIRYDPAIPTRLIGDPLRLGQVLLNLCSNAVKFTEEGEVELAFRVLGSGANDIQIQVCVRDSGIGMSQEVQQKLFQKFTQADQTTTRRFGGTGLGLAICKNLTELMGGRIWVEDSQPGRGTTICFTVSLKIDHRSRSRQRDLLDQAGPLLTGIRALVVDDNEVSREILAELLRFFRLDVGTAVDGPSALAALEAAAKSPYDLVFMDWRMPRMNGDEATQRIHSDPHVPHKPKVVLVTAYGREDVIRLAEQAGVDGFLIKPVSPSIMLDTILSVLGRGRIIRGSNQKSPSAVISAGVSPLAGARLLLVEDNEINREFATELLRGEGIEIDEAVNGAEAVERVQNKDYDAVLMDIQMPVMDGLEACRRIRALAETVGRARFADLPIIAMTALAMAEDAEKSRAAGMNDHVSKPIAPEQLMAVLTQWIHLAPSRGGVLPPAPVGSASHELPADLKDLASLDAHAGVRRIGGKPEAYRRQLQRFREHYANAFSELRRRLAGQDIQAAEEYCHALKGVTGNLGAQALYEKLVELDTRLKAGLRPEVAALDEAEALMRTVLDEIDGLSARERQSPTTAAKPLAPEALRTLLGRLSEALTNDLGAVDPLLAELRSGVAGSPLESEVAALAGLIDIFEIDEALIHLKQLEARQAGTAT